MSRWIERDRIQRFRANQRKVLEISPEIDEEPSAGAEE